MLDLQTLWTRRKTYIAKKQIYILWTLNNSPVSIISEFWVFSKVPELLRIPAYLSRFIANFKTSLNKEKINLDKKSTIEEISFAERLWFMYLEKDIFSVNSMSRARKRFGLYYYLWNYHIYNGTTEGVRWVW